MFGGQKLVRSYCSSIAAAVCVEQIDRYLELDTWYLVPHTKHEEKIET